MPGYGECFERAVTAAIAGATVLAPNTRSARAIRHAAEDRLRLTRPAWPTLDVVPFGAFVERLYSEAVVSGCIEVRPLQRHQELHLWRQVIERSASGRELLLQESAASLAAESFRTAMEYDIKLDSPAMSASSDTRAFSGWVLEFQHQLVSHQWTCPALFIDELLACLPSLRLPKSVFAFSPDPTPTQQKLLDELAACDVQIESAEHAYASTHAEPVQRYEFDGVTDELRTAAQWARRQVESSPQARVGVIVFDLDRKLPQVEHAFRSVLHPEHLLGQSTPRAYEIASPLPLAEYPVVCCALRLLSFFAGSIDFHSFCSMLASPYLDLDPVAVARFLAQSRKSSRLQVDTDDLRNWLQRSNELPRLRVALESLPKSSAFSTEHSVAYWADLTRKLLETFGWPGRAPLNSDEYQCSETWKDLLVSISSLELFAWKSDFTQFVNRLQSAASTQRFKSESHNVPIQIMDAAEAEGSTFDALWVASCCDDLWPDTPRHSPLIPGALLREAGVPILGTPDAELRISHITARLLQSAPQVFLSMARRSDDEREQRWSPCFLSYPLAPEAIAKPLLLAESFRSEDIEILSDSSAPAVQPNEIARGGTWLLQDQSNCPFRAFAIRRLLARESEGPNEAIAPTERGNVVDRALQLIWEELKGSEGLRTSDVAAVIEAATDKAMSLELPPTTDPWTLRFRALERQRTIEVLTNWITLESTREPFHVLGHQLPVELNLSGLTLRGYVDRLDEVEDAHIIIDYKTGAKNVINAWQVPRPRMPQLPFYALAMKQQKLDVAGISFAIVRKDNCEFRSYLRHSDVLPGHDSAKRTFEGVSIDDYTAKWATELEELAASFLKGNAAVDPKVPQGRNGSPCEHCHLTPLCRIGDLAGDDFESIEESYE